MAVAAGGSSLGGMADWAGQRDWTAATGAGHGTTEGFGGRQGKCRLEEVAAGLVLGSEGISGRVVGEDWGETRRATSWRGIAGIGRAEGGETDCGDVAGSGMDRTGITRAQERRQKKGGHGEAFAQGDNNDMELDSEATGDGTLADGSQCCAKNHFKKEIMENTNSHL